MPKLKAGANYFWKKHHPALGIRIPEIVLNGIMAALAKYSTASGIELSFGRETSLQKIVAAPLGEYPISLGHTGTSIPHYLKAAESAAREAGLPIQLEGDHLIIIGAPEMAVKRIEGVFEKHTVDPKKLKKSFEYNFSAIDEALATAPVRCFTTDTSDLIWHEADKLSKGDLEKELVKHLSEKGQRKLFSRYLDREFKIKTMAGTDFIIEFDRPNIIRLFLKYVETIRGNARLYDYLYRKISSRAFGFEISMDETQYLTPVEDAFFYLTEWTASGRHFDYFAPNIGFTKRADYAGSLKTLQTNVAKMAGIANYFNEGIISFHSGSGSTPYSGKGEGVYEILVNATGGRLKYKISGVYYELLMELLHGGAAGKTGKDLYEEIFDRVHEYCVDQIKKQGELASDLLKKQLAQYDKDLASKKCKPRDPRADFFRFNSWLALAFRDDKANRIYREKLVKLYNHDNKLKARVDEEVFALTERLIVGLKFEGN